MRFRDLILSFNSLAVILGSVPTAIPMRRSFRVFIQTTDKPLPRKKFSMMRFSLPLKTFFEGNINPLLNSC